MSFWKIGEVQKNPKKGACNMLEGKLSLVMVMHLPKFQVHFDCTVNLSHEVCLGIDENISCNCSMFLCLYPSHFNLFLFISYHKTTIYFQMFNVSEQFSTFSLFLVPENDTVIANLMVSPKAPVMFKLFRFVDHWFMNVSIIHDNSQ